MKHENHENYTRSAIFLHRCGCCNNKASYLKNKETHEEQKHYIEQVGVLVCIYTLRLNAQI